MKQRRFMSVAVLLTISSLAGCALGDAGNVTSNVGSPQPSSSTGQSSSSIPSATESDSFETLPLEGTFLSQGAQVSGEVRLEKTSPGEVTVTITNFKSDPATDLRLHLNVGALVNGTDGSYYVDSGSVFEFPGNVDSDTATQTFLYSDVGGGLGAPFLSVSVYNYGAREAWGSASLEPAAS